MLIYDQTSIAFIKRSQEMLKEILREIKIEVKQSRFLLKRFFYPITVVVFESPTSSELGHFDASYYQIALNKKLIYLAKDSVLRDILRHELAHYLTFIEHGRVQAHGPEFKNTCLQYGFPDEVALATMNLQHANDDKQGDLDSEKVIEKVKKLLQLAQSSNTHEAELATMKANSLLLRHNLDHIQHDDEPIYVDQILQRKRKDDKMVAIFEILRHFIVRPVFNKGIGVCSLDISGSLTNVKLARYIGEFLDQELDYLWETAKKEHSLSGLRAKNSFFMGIAQGFDQKMKASKANLSTTDQKSLLVVEKDLSEKFKLVYTRLSSFTSERTTDSEAKAAGIQKGRNLNIRQGVESSSSKNLYLSYSKS